MCFYCPIMVILENRISFIRSKWWIKKHAEHEKNETNFSRCWSVYQMVEKSSPAQSHPSKRSECSIETYRFKDVVLSIERIETGMSSICCYCSFLPYLDLYYYYFIFFPQKWRHQIQQRHYRSKWVTGIWAMRLIQLLLVNSVKTQHGVFEPILQTE